MKQFIGLCVLVTAIGTLALAEETKLDSKALVQMAKRHQLPMPPPNAKLVLAHTGGRTSVGNSSTSRDPGIYSPAFLLKENGDGTIEVLRGANREEIKHQRSNEPPWLPFSTDRLEPKLGGHIARFSQTPTFVCAVQAAALGDESSAQALWNAFHQKGVDDDQQLLLEHCIFDYLRDQLLQEEVDYKAIRSKMSTLLSESSLTDDFEAANLYERLRKTVDAEPPPEGSVEALLLDWAKRTSTLRHLGLYHEYEEAKADESARKIVLRGLDSVPELIQLLDDPRLTVHETRAFMMAEPRIKSVGDLAEHLLLEIIGDQPALANKRRYPSSIRNWWAKAKSMDEKTILLDGVLQGGKSRNDGFNESTLRILALKYPETLAKLCDEFSSRAGPDVQPYHLAEAIAIANLPIEQRVALLSSFAQRGSLEQKRCILQNLAKVDGAACKPLLLSILKDLPQDASQPYWTCPEANFTHVVVQLDDLDVWRAYLKAAKRSSVGLRMEMLNPLNYTYIREKNLELRLAFLAAFLDDEEVRDVSKDAGKFDGPHAGFTIARLAVRDLAAQKLASLLNLNESPDEFWLPEHWQALRDKVRAKLTERKLPKLDVAK